MAKAKRKPAQEEDFGFIADEDTGFVPDESMAFSEDGFVPDTEEYAPPEPFETSRTLPNLEAQQEVAKLGKKFGQGASFGWGEEAVAGLKTGSLSSPEYVTQRDIYRKELADIDKQYPILGPLAEATGSTVTSSMLPFMNASKGARLAKELGTAAFQGGGEAPTMEEIPEYAGVSAGLQLGMEALGGVGKKLLFDDSNKILAKSIGVKQPDMKARISKDLPSQVKTSEIDIIKELAEDEPEVIGTNASIVKAISNLDKSGFFKQGKVSLDLPTRKFARIKGGVKDLSGFLKPQSLENLADTASTTLSSLKSRNTELLKNKSIPLQEIKDKVGQTISNFTYDPSGHNAEAKIQLANDLQDIIFKDIKFYTSGTGTNIPALEVEMAKKRLDNYLKGPAFEKRTADLGVDKQGAMKIRKAFDQLLDSDKVGGAEYKKNNDMMHDLIRVKKVIDRKIDRDYIDTGSGLMDVRGAGQWLKETFLTPTYADIARSDISKGLDTKPGQFFSGVLKRTPVEAIVRERNAGRSPQSIGVTQKDIVNYKIPRETKSILENKDLILAKLVQNGVPDEMVDTFSQALNEDHEAVSNIMPLLITQFPTLFQRSKYNVFDGKFMDPNDRAKAADDISKRDDINSIQRAKMISRINKTGEVPEGLE